MNDSLPGVSTPSPRLFAVSGKMGSGKDTLAFRALEMVGITDAVQFNVGDAIRAELDGCFDAYRSGGSVALAERVAVLPGTDSSLPEANARVIELTMAVIDEVDNETPEAPANAHRRTGNVRTGLQQLAALVRSADTSFWITRLLAAVTSHAQTGSTIVTTDLREPEEIVALEAAGYVIVRVNVTEHTQLARLNGRDGIVVDGKALKHPNETALDDMSPAIAAAFAAVIDNDGELDEAALRVAKVLSARWGVPVKGANGLFVVFEGIEGCGKSTLSRAVSERLKALGLDVVHTNEPGGTELGAVLRAEALSTKHDRVTEALLFAADRASHCAEVIAPALERGAIVLCDRFEASSVAYQGAWRGLGEQQVIDVSRFASSGLQADLTVWLKIDPVVAAARRTAHADALDAVASKIEVASVLDASFEKQAQWADRPWWAVDATTPADELAELVTGKILAHLGAKEEVATPRPGTLLLVTGPSGSGKNTVVETLTASRDDVWYSISSTTREPRQGETDGVDYNFVSEADFDELVASDGLLEWAEYAGHRYGTPSAPVLDRLARGVNVACIIELDGAEQIKAAVPESVLVFIQPPSWEELVARLRSRGTEDETLMEKRLVIARHEMNVGPGYADRVIVNADVAHAVEELATILK